MSKESRYALPCIGCGIPMTFFKNHTPHCKNPFRNPIIAKVAATLSKNPPVNKEF